MSQAFYSLPDFAAAIAPKGRLMALDVGTVTIGVAMSDANRVVASPDFTIARRKWSHDVAELKRLMDSVADLQKTTASHAVCGFIIGYPLNMDGSAGPRAQATRAFARNMQLEFNLPILLWDERLSTAAVTRMMIEADLSRKRRSELVDKLAASYILQGVLDGLGRN